MGGLNAQPDGPDSVGPWNALDLDLQTWNNAS